MKSLLKPIANVCFIITCCLISCNNEKKTDPEKKEPEKKEGNYSFIYDFTDSSVPPEYHRSFSIKVMPGRVYLKVHSYGDLLLSDTTSLSDEAYAAFSKSISDLNIRSTKEKDNDGCTGGTTDELDLYSGTSQQVKGHLYNCGGKIYGTLEGDVEAAKKLFLNAVPDIDKKIEGTRKPG